MTKTQTKISILGTEWRIIWSDYEDDKEFKEDKDTTGYCSYPEKIIVMCRLHTHPDYKDETNQSMEFMENYILRHEIIHAFLFESGLLYSTHDTKHGWSVDEEIIDWIAYQFPKISKVFEECECCKYIEEE